MAAAARPMSVCPMVWPTWRSIFSRSSASWIVAAFSSSLPRYSTEPMRGRSLTTARTITPPLGPRSVSILTSSNNPVCQRLRKLRWMRPGSYGSPGLMPRYTRMVSLATVVLPTASKRSMRWPVCLPGAGVVGGGAGFSPSVMPPAFGRSMIWPGFGFCGCGWGGALDCASALVASIAAAMQKRSRFIGRRKLLAVRRGNSRGGSAGAQQRESAAHSNIGNILVMLSIRRVLPLLFLAVSARAQGPNYLVSPNVVYGVASGQELKLDVYRPRDAAAPVPVAMFIHGGGWVAGTKEGSA